VGNDLSPILSVPKRADLLRPETSTWARLRLPAAHGSLSSRTRGFS